MGKVLVYYKYIDIEYPKRLLKWQHKICTELGLKGRIIIAHEGINGTVGGTDESVDRYQKIMKENSLFADVDFKESPGDADCFPRLSIKIKEEITKLGLDTKLIRAENGGKHLTPAESHELMAKSPDNLVILDARNDYEWKIGSFEGAIKPDIRYFRELPGYIDTHLDQFKDKQVLMFCTGGVRCERASAYLKSKEVAQEVYQIEGGIHRYAEQFPDGFFRGKNYVFDGRIATTVNPDIVSTCSLCSTESDNYENCANASCNNHFISCISCVEKFDHACGETCATLLREHKVGRRPAFKKAAA